MVLRFPEVVGTAGDDVITGAPNSVTFGLAGNDTLVGAVGDSASILIGGSGADTYIVNNDTTVVIANFISSDGDKVVATGVGFSTDTSFFFTVDNRHYVAGDLESGQVVLAIDSLDPVNRIETIELADGSFTFDEFLGPGLNVPNFLGNVPWVVAEELGFEGVVAAINSPDFPFDFPSDLAGQLESNEILTAEINEAIAFYEARAAELEAIPQALVDSGLFDADFYLLNNPDVAAAGLNPLVHFDQFGWREGRDPSALFDTDFYLEASADVAAADLDPVVHYFDFGALEGRDPNPLFDSDFYLETNMDVAAAGLNPLAHYAGFGWLEGRDPSLEFDNDAYLEANGDVADAGFNPLAHYLEFGIFEGREVFPVDVVA